MTRCPIRSLVGVALSVVVLHATGSAVHGAEQGMRDVWDLDAIKAMPLEVEVISETRSEADGTQYLEREILYTSQITDGEPVRALAYLTIPLGSNEPLPALVSIRALWGPSHKANSVGYAREYGVVSLGIHLPEGQSRAVWPENFAAPSDDDKKCEESYFYLLATAAMRGVTYLGTLPEVNPHRIGITGFSRGGMAALIVNGVDDRIRAAIPIAATGFSAEGLQQLEEIYPDRRLTGSTSRFNPLDYAHTQHGAVFMIIGAQDPIFAYAEASTTFDTIRAEKRLEMVFDWGHGSYISDPDAEATFDENAEKKMLRVKLNTKAWIDWWLFDRGAMPDGPTVSMKSDGANCTFTARIEPEDATRTLLIYSTDGANMFKKQAMKGVGVERTAGVQLSEQQQKSMTYYVEVEYADRCFLSSAPVMAEEFSESAPVGPVLYEEGN